MFYMSTFLLPAKVISINDRYRRAFFWKGNSFIQGGSCLVAWNTICLPKKAGGLEIINIKRQNEAPLLKSLYKFFKKKDIPWVNFFMAKIL